MKQEAKFTWEGRVYHFSQTQNAGTFTHRVSDISGHPLHEKVNPTEPFSDYVVKSVERVVYPPIGVTP